MSAEVLRLRGHVAAPGLAAGPLVRLRPDLEAIRDVGKLGNDP